MGGGLGGGGGGGGGGGWEGEGGDSSFWVRIRVSDRHRKVAGSSPRVARENFLISPG